MLLGCTLILFQAMNPILASALIPGWGELLTGRKNQARSFFIVEGALWTAYAGFKYTGTKMESSSRAFAVDHSGANPAAADAEYYDVLEDYLSADDYNLEIERDAGLYYPDDPRRQQEYIQENGYFGEDAWQWDTSANRTHYWQTRRDARAHLQRASFMIGFAMINRLVSVLDVALLSGQDKVGLEAKDGAVGLYYRF